MNEQLKEHLGSYKLQLEQLSSQHARCIEQAQKINQAYNQVQGSIAALEALLKDLEPVVEAQPPATADAAPSPEGA